MNMLHEKLMQQEQELNVLKEESRTQAHQIEELKDIVESTKNLEKKINVNETKILHMDSLMFVKDRVIEELQKQLNDLQQYTRRYSVIVNGIKVKQGRETNDDLRVEVNKLLEEANVSDVTKNEVDKFHRNGPRKDDEQSIIIRFKSHSAKEEFYKKRKNIKRRYTKIYPSLTSTNRSLLESSRKFLEENHNESTDGELLNPPHFVLADMHGNISVKMKYEHKNRLFFNFSSIQQLMRIINTCQEDGE